MTVEGAGRPPNDSLAPVVISDVSASDPVIESTLVSRSQRSRSWLIGGVHNFRPPELGWYYIYITSQVAKFWDRKSILLFLQEPAVTIFPPGVNHAVTLTGPAFVFGVRSVSPREIDPSAWPRTAKISRIESALENLEGSRLRLVAGSESEDEVDWKDRDWSYDERRRAITKKQVLVNKMDGFELSFADETTRQAAHSSERSSESYASSSSIQVFWGGTHVRTQTEAGPTVIVAPPSLCHEVKLSGTTCVLRVSDDGLPVEDVTPCSVKD